MYHDQIPLLSDFKYFFNRGSHFELDTGINSLQLSPLIGGSGMGISPGQSLGAFAQEMAHGGKVEPSVEQNRCQKILLSGSAS